MRGMRHPSGHLSTLVISDNAASAFFPPQLQAGDVRVWVVTSHHGSGSMFGSQVRASVCLCD